MPPNFCLMASLSQLSNPFIGQTPAEKNNNGRTDTEHKCRHHQSKLSRKGFLGSPRNQMSLEITLNVSSPSPDSREDENDMNGFRARSVLTPMQVFFFQVFSVRKAFMHFLAFMIHRSAQRHNDQYLFPKRPYLAHFPENLIFIF